jgi:hypothetical protein
MRHRGHAGASFQGPFVAFLRFVTSKSHPDSGVEAGIFTVAYSLHRAAGVRGEDRERLKEHLAWFEEHLRTPARFNRSGSKGFYRRKTRGVAWFRDTASACISRMHALKTILETYGYPVTLVREERVGYVIYEDDLQVVAEPFTDTRTGE